MGQKNDFWAKFLRSIYTLYKKSGTIWKTASPSKNQFWGHRGFFWPFFRGGGTKIGCGSHFKEVGQLQKFSQKKLTIFVYIPEFSAPLYDKNSLRYLKKLLPLFFPLTVFFNMFLFFLTLFPVYRKTIFDLKFQFCS